MGFDLPVHVLRFRGQGILPQVRHGKERRKIVSWGQAPQGRHPEHPKCRRNSAESPRPAKTIAKVVTAIASVATPISASVKSLANTASVPN